ncbi:MAG: hypothetical protein KJ718_05560 [Nanoarchaeota archaeon]|nr:hypothetical protein [Nanoarchaeota archaeon]MBU1051990.1 hypothetical protein [Nanoarchaeota archaeon]MBU1988252.1 hypothetical protein [Nanoarchaeota archaeon]
MTKNKVKIVGIRPPETNLTLSGYGGVNGMISVAPIRPKVPSLGLFHVGTVLKQELKNEGYDSDISFEDMASSEPETLSPYAEDFSKYSKVPYGPGVIHKMLRGKSLSSLENTVQDSDVCFISSLFTAGATSTAQTMETIKKHNPNVILLIGGRDAQYRPEWYLQKGADAVFLGQAEGLVGKVTASLLNGRQVNFPGVATRLNIGNLGKTKIVDRERLESLGVNSLNKSTTTISRNTSLEQETFPNFDLIILSEYSESCDGALPSGVTGPVMWYQTSVGCPRSCDFCPSARDPYFSLSASRVDRMLEYYRGAGIRTILSAEDNFLARLLNKNELGQEPEQEIVDIMKLIRLHGLAHEFSNGLEVGLLINRDGSLREHLIENLFAHDRTESGVIGTYRMYWPIETLIGRDRFKKLVKKKDHYRILDAVLQTGIPEIVFNSILFSDYGSREIDLFRRGLGEFCDWMIKHQRQTKWSLPIFHELPLPGSKSYEGLLSRSFDINLHPELWAVPINPTNGAHYSYDELYSIKRKLMEEFDLAGLKEWDMLGRYGTTTHTNENRQ